MPLLTLSRWQWVHRWSSLVCTAFLLIICVTGLPLIFAEEIDQLTDPTHYARLPANAPRASLDKLKARSLRDYPGQIATSIYVDDDEPQVYVWMAPSFAALEADPKLGHYMRFDARSGAILGRTTPQDTQGMRFMTVMLRLHMDLFAGLPGELFLGAMGLLFVAAVVSGVVGLTGMMNELSTPLFALRRHTEVAAMLAPSAGRSPLDSRELSSPQAAYDTAARALPGMVVTGITFPGDRNGTPLHYVIWAHGKSHLTSQLYSPVLVDPRSGALTTVVAMPWYLRLLEVSRPLHFGNYGGVPLKILWALLDVVTILVLGSGLYLWLARQRRPRAAVALPVSASGLSPVHLELAE